MDPEIVPRTSQGWVRFGYSGAGVCVYIVDQGQGKDSFATIVVSEEIDMDKENVDLPERRKRRA